MALGIIFAVAYVTYGRFLARQMDLRNNYQTPAHEINDGLDYVPARASLLLGQHFSAIAAAGPIVGPILAAMWFGWLPAWLWIWMYVIGVSAAAFHFSNGIVTFCITWGIAVGVESRKKLSLVAGALCIVLMLWGFVSLHALTTMTRTAPGAAEVARGNEQRISTPYMARHEAPSAARE